MNKITVTNATSGALVRRLKEIGKDVDTGSRKFDRFRLNLSKIAREDNVSKLLLQGETLRGVDRFGRVLDPLAKSTNFKDRGYGNVLVPRTLGSRFITNYFARWSSRTGTWVLATGWNDLKFAIYHLQGCRKGSNPKRPNWSLPKRDIGGIGKQGWVKVHAEFKRFASTLLKS